MRVVVQIKETLGKVVVCDAESVMEGIVKVEDAYKNGVLELDADNSVVSVEFEDISEEYVDDVALDDIEYLEY